MRLILLGAIALAISSPAAAALAPPQREAPGYQQRADAHALAETIAPREIMVPLNLKWGKQGILSLPKHDPEAKALEAEYPGIHQAMWAASEAELHRQMDSDLPELWTRLEALYLSELSGVEIAGLLKFYRTPTGQRMIRSMYANLDLTDAIAGMAKSPDSALDETSLVAAQEAAKRKTISELTLDPADFRILLGAVPLDRLRSVGAKAQQVTAEWMNESDPEGEKKLGDLMKAGADRYIEQRESQE